jgi:hypothetical protein
MRMLVLAAAFAGVWTTSGFCQTPSADIPNIAGTYLCKTRCSEICKGKASIEQTASGIILTNECEDQHSQGQVTSPNSFTATTWGLTGTITDSNSRLIFSDGTEWVKQ